MDVLSNLTNTYQKNKSPMAFVAIVLGQASLSCRRFGICKMKPIEEEEELLSTHFDCLAYLSPIPEGNVQLQFLREWMTDQVYHKYFARGIFKINESFKIPAKICMQLDCKEPLIIPAGQFPIVNETIQFSSSQEAAA